MVDQAEVSEILADEPTTSLLNPSPNVSPNNSNNLDLINPSPSATMTSPGGFSSQFSLDYDENNGFPSTRRSAILPWTLFTVDIYSSEANAERAIDVMEENFEEWVDLRPYMIEYPHTCSIYESFQQVLTQFRINHLRHLMVVDPSNG
mmetsp:Transcript_35690/g.43690  ORF Transcript_35690/g.43690 Transcript_35690/m.43690 type:complete len:148 (+) Transcript_35690:1918-2361(+)